MYYFLTKRLENQVEKVPLKKIVQLIIEMKKRNPRFGYLRIAMQIQHAFGITLDKQYKPTAPCDDGPSWLTFIGQMKDSLWSIDLFRCESIHLQSHWVMVVMDQFTRRMIGFATHKGAVGGIDLCCMFNTIMSGKNPPKYLSSDNDPLFKFHRWRANLRILEVEEIKSVPYTPTSHPFIERLMGTVRREYLDQLFFWNGNDLQNKLDKFKHYYNSDRAHSSLNRDTPEIKSEQTSAKVISIEQYRWKLFARGLFQLPIAA